MHVFFDTVWKLHIGEIPKKPIDVQHIDFTHPTEGLKHLHVGGDPLAYENRLKKYNAKIAAIKQNALTVGNADTINVSSLLPSDPKPGEFYKWVGGYETKEKELWTSEREPASCFTTVAILTLPEEKTPNNHTMKTEPIAIFNPKQISPESYSNAVKAALLEVGFEVERAKTLFPSMFINQHEAIAVIREEYLELEQECFKNQRNYDLEAQRKEAKQLAAMAIRLMVELT